MKYYGLLLLSTLLSTGCFQESKDSHIVYKSDIPEGTRWHAEINVDLTQDLETYDVRPTEPKILRHTREGEVVFVSRPIKTPIWFQRSKISYQYPFPMMRNEAARRVSFAVRYSTDGEVWTHWQDRFNFFGEGTSEPEGGALLLPYGDPYFHSWGEVFHYLQFKIISAPENKGQVVLENMRLSVLRFDDVKKKPPKR